MRKLFKKAAVVFASVCVFGATSFAGSKTAHAQEDATAACLELNDTLFNVLTQFREDNFLEEKYGVGSLSDTHERTIASCGESPNATLVELKATAKEINDLAFRIVLFDKDTARVSQRPVNRSAFKKLNEFVFLKLEK